MALTERDEERLHSICRTLTPQQLRFVAERPHYSDDAECSRAIGIPFMTIRQWPQKIHTAVRLMAQDGIVVSQEILRKGLALAAQRKIEALNSADIRIQQAAATEILNRFHGMPTQRAEVTGAEGGPITLEVVYVNKRENNQDRTPDAP